MAEEGASKAAFTQLLEEDLASGKGHFGGGSRLGGVAKISGLRGVP